MALGPADVVLGLTCAVLELAGVALGPACDTELANFFVVAFPDADAALEGVAFAAAVAAVLDVISTDDVCAAGGIAAVLEVALGAVGCALVVAGVATEVPGVTVEMPDVGVVAAEVPGAAVEVDEIVAGLDGIVVDVPEDDATPDDVAVIVFANAAILSPSMMFSAMSMATSTISLTSFAFALTMSAICSLEHGMSFESILMVC